MLAALTAANARGNIEYISWLLSWYCFWRESLRSIIKESGFDDYLLNTNLFNTEQLLKLNENNIKTRDQLADLSNVELIEIFREMDKDKADEIIMDSRQHWYKN